VVLELQLENADSNDQSASPTGGCMRWRLKQVCAGWGAGGTGGCASTRSPDYHFRITLEPCESEAHSLI
jgi:hypothetical protein